MMGHIIAQTSLFAAKNDAISSHYRRFKKQRFFSRKLSAIVASGYLRVARNALAGLVRSVGCANPVANIRRLECRILSKQLWPLAFSSLFQLVLSKKKRFLLKSQWLWKNQQLSTKIPTERAFQPVPHPSSKLPDFAIGGSLPNILGTLENSLIPFYSFAIRHDIFTAPRRRICSQLQSLFLSLELLPLLGHVRPLHLTLSRPSRFITSMAMQQAAAHRMERLRKFQEHIIRSKAEILALRPSAWMAIRLGQIRSLARRHIEMMMVVITNVAATPLAVTSQALLTNRLVSADKKAHTNVATFHEVATC